MGKVTIYVLPKTSYDVSLVIYYHKRNINEKIDYVQFFIEYGFKTIKIWIKIYKSLA